MSPPDPSSAPRTLAEATDRIRAVGASLAADDLTPLDQADLVVGLIRHLMEAALPAIDAVDDPAEQARLAQSIVKGNYDAARSAGPVRDAAILKAMQSGNWKGAALARHIDWKQARVGGLVADWRKEGKLPPLASKRQAG